MDERSEKGMLEGGLQKLYLPWPRETSLIGPGRYADVGTFADIIQDAAEEGWWASDWQLKYLSISIDTRSGHFVLKDRDGDVIEVDRVLKAIDDYRATFGGSAKMGEPVRHPMSALIAQAGEPKASGSTQPVNT